MNDKENNEIDINFHIKKPNKYIILLFSILLVLIFGIFDFISGYEISFSIFYLIPISLTIIFTDFKFAIIISLLSTINWYLADIYSGHVYVHNLIPVWNSIVRLGYFTLHSYLVSKFIKLYDIAKYNSLTDSLTQAINSKFFYELFERELKRAERLKNSFTLIYLDLDNFKIMNDKFGHQTGDLLLKKISKIIKNTIRRYDVFARMGGDEFVLLFPDSSYEISKKLINRIKEKINNEMIINNWPVTVSMGAVTYSIFNLTVDEMIKQADDLMYEVKNSSKNDVKHILYK